MKKPQPLTSQRKIEPDVVKQGDQSNGVVQEAAKKVVELQRQVTTLRAKLKQKDKIILQNEAENEVCGVLETLTAKLKIK